MSFLERNSYRLHYQVGGTGQPVVLTHGYSATHAMWRGQVEALSDTCQVLTWDMHGHGATESSDNVSDYSERNTVEDMAALMDACGMDRAVIGGLSLGGYMSLAFYLAFPERVSALMLFDTGPGFKKDDARQKWNDMALARADALEKKGFDKSKARGAEVQLAEHKSAMALGLAARGMLAQADGRVINSLPHIQVPTLVLVGADDTPFLAATDYMATKIPGATKVVIDDAGHAANIDQPDAFNSAVKKFLAGLPG